MYCVNLTRRTDRRERVSREFEREGLDVEFFDATDGRVDTPNGLKITPPEYGCADSHIRIWRDVIKKGYPWALILEDDVVLQPGFKQKLEDVIAEAPKNYDIIYVGYLFESNGCTVSKNLVEIQALGTHAYIISQAGARKIYRFESKLLKTSIDALLASLPIRTLGIREPIVTQLIDWKTSDIGRERCMPFEHFEVIYRKQILLILPMILVMFIEYFRKIRL